jgi:hypothetical protein
MKEARIKVPLQVSTVGSANAIPLTIHECTKILSGLDGEVRNPQCLFTFPQHEKKNLNFEVQPKNYSMKRDESANSLCSPEYGNRGWV